MGKTHGYISVVEDYGISPRYRELLIFLGQKECYARGSLELELVLGLRTSDSQIHRLTNDYGARIESVLAQETPAYELDEDEVIYAQVDGRMLFTRESGWQEVKIGRVFPSSARVPISKERGFVHRSEYAAYLGGHSAFETRMSVLLDKYESLAERLVFITDGAPWIANWIKAEYPKARMILDVFHAKEYLSQFLEAYFGKQDHAQRYQAWAQYLLQEGGQEVVERIEKLPPATKKAEAARDKILQYYRNNAYRMDYPQYLKNGWQIGSGAIEAVHRTLAQRRLKLSGQRWSKTGAQNVLNLRTLNMSGRWKQLQLILKAA